MSLRALCKSIGVLVLAAAAVNASAFPHDHNIGAAPTSGEHDPHLHGGNGHGGDRPSVPPHGQVPSQGWHHQWGNGDPHYFPYHDWHYWHGGYWHRGWYGPRFGWWWVVSGVWFYYPQPVYPYPNPYVPSGFAAPPPPAGSAQPATQYWYYCPAVNGYYPYIAECPNGWQQVLPTPPGADKDEVPGG